MVEFVNGMDPKKDALEYVYNNLDKVKEGEFPLVIDVCEQVKFGLTK